jgi:hypothetical protein
MAESFRETEKLVIKQKFEAIEALANAAANAVDMDTLGNLGEIANTYDVFTDDGGDKYRVVEESDYCGLTGRACCNPNHALQLHVFQPGESKDSQAMVFDRPCKCGSCCAFCDICQQEMTVFEGKEETGNVIGYVKQPFLGGGFSPTLDIMDREGGETIATVKSNAVCCIAGVCCDHTFEVIDPQGNSLGKIVKVKPSDLGEVAKEMVSDADVFALEYSNKEANVKTKASMFASLYLIDYMFFENEGELNIDLVNQACSIKCCDLYCCGCVCPCACNCGGGDDDDDEFDDDDNNSGGEFGGDE